MGSIPGCCLVQSYQRRLKMGVVSSCMVLTSGSSGEGLLPLRKNRLPVFPADRKRGQKGETFMMSTTNSNTKSDAGSTQNKLQRPSVGNQAEDGLSATGRNPKQKVTRDQHQRESDQTRSGTQNSEGVENSSPHSKRAYTARKYNRGNWPRYLVVESLKAGKTLASVSPFLIARSIAGNAGTV